jgi:eukaryotic-like serine/threonine-protein kinase
MQGQDATSLAGRTLERYLIGAQIGRGGMGVVYRARDARTGRELAFKVLQPAAGQEAIDRLHREAFWLAHCRDPHIVTVFDAGRAGGVDYIAMELMAATLQSRIGSCLPATGEIVDVGIGMLTGLAAAHRLGVIHRDIKPANIGIARDGTIKLLDFGVANALPWYTHAPDSATISPPPWLVGTLDYMPPEQLRGDPLDERVDVYSAGAVLYELATGLPPFPEARPACLIDAILNTTPVPPSAMHPQLDPALDAVLCKALDKAPSRRFPSAPAMLAALRAVPGGVTAEDGRARTAAACDAYHSSVVLEGNADGPGL